MCCDQSPPHAMEDPVGRCNGAVIEYERSQLKDLMVDGANEGVPRESEISGVKRSRYSTIDGANDAIHVEKVKNPSIKAFSKGTTGADVAGGKRSRRLTADGGKDHIRKKSGMNLELQGTGLGGLSGLTGGKRSRSLTIDGAKSGIRLSDMRLKATMEADGSVVKMSRSSSDDGAKNGGFTLDFEGKSKLAMDADMAAVKNSKLLIKLPFKTGGKGEKDDQKQVKEKHNDEKDDGFGGKDDDTGTNNNSNNDLDEETKTWNLRPRKPTHKSLNDHGIKSTPAKNVVRDHHHSNNNNKVARSPLRNLIHQSAENEGNCVGGGEKKVKRKLTIDLSLSKDEIEEDIFVMTGSKPARRPKKRAKNVLKQLEYVFPGAWLVGINADSYKVSEPLMKV